MTSEEVSWLLAVSPVTFVAVSPDHCIGLVRQPLALRDARSQPLLILLQLPGVAVAPGDVIFLVGDRDFLSQ